MFERSRDSVERTKDVFLILTAFSSEEVGVHEDAPDKRKKGLLTKI